VKECGIKVNLPAQKIRKILFCFKKNKATEKRIGLPKTIKKNSRSGSRGMLNLLT
jgi:hypothetical protein